MNLTPTRQVSVFCFLKRSAVRGWWGVLSQIPLRSSSETGPNKTKQTSFQARGVGVAMIGTKAAQTQRNKNKTNRGVGEVGSPRKLPKHSETKTKQASFKPGWWVGPDPYARTRNKKQQQKTLHHSLILFIKLGFESGDYLFSVFVMFYKCLIGLDK